LARDLNAAINILLKALRTVGHTGTWEIDNFLNAWGDGTSTLVGEILSKQVLSMNQESPPSTK
jgi:putative transposase